MDDIVAVDLDQRQQRYMACLLTFARGLLDPACKEATLQVGWRKRPGEIGRYADVEIW